MKQALLALAALAGCIDDNYECHADSDCNVGVAGRCELDHRCTQYEGTCPLLRRYSDHSGALSGACFVDAVAPVDPCASGQPPAPTTDPCAMMVCASQPTCCLTGWTETCVQQAQLACGVRCDTRIAVMAEDGTVAKPTNLELWDLRYEGMEWSATRPAQSSQLVTWLAPAPGDSAPRLATLDAPGANLVVDDGANTSTYAVDTTRHYDAVSTVDFDRSGRDTAMLASYDTAGHTLFDLAASTARDIASTMPAPVETWGDYDGDGFPDAVATNASNAKFHFVGNDLAPDYTREIDDTVSADTTADESPTIRSFAWTDLDHDGRVDLIEFGGGVQIHFGSGDLGLSTTSGLRVDCDPPTTYKSASTCSNYNTVSYTGTILPLASGSTELIVSLDDTTTASSRTRNLYALVLDGQTLKTPTALLTPCTGPTCVPLRAIVARDVDGDNKLDIVAIDSLLQVLYARGNGDGTFAPLSVVHSIPTMESPFTDVRVSVTGALH